MKRLVSGIMCALFAFTCFNSVQITAFASYEDARNKIISELESFDNAELFNFVDTVKDIPSDATIVDQQYKQEVRKRYSVDYDSVTMDITEYTNDSITIDLITLKTNSTVDLPNIVVDESEFTFCIQQKNLSSDYVNKDYHGSSVTDVPMYNNDNVTHRVQAVTTYSRGEKFATISISRNMKIATKSVEIIGFAKIIHLDDSPNNYSDEVDYKQDLRRWCDDYSADVYFVSLVTKSNYNSTTDIVCADSDESYKVIDDLITNTYNDKENGSDGVYWIAQKPKLSSEDCERLTEFFGNGFDYSKCKIDYISDVSSSPIMLPMHHIIFNESLIARPEYDLGMTIHYFDKSGIEPKIMFNEEYEGKINKLTDEQTYIKTLEGSLDEKSEEISRLKSEISKLKAQNAVISYIGDVNSDSCVDVSDAQLILNYYVYTLADNNAEPFEDWISKN